MCIFIMGKCLRLCVVPARLAERSNSVTLRMILFLLCILIIFRVNIKYFRERFKSIYFFLAFAAGIVSCVQLFL